jgi:protein-S-isoprenylcysteine O-methyltransferase Ste14
VIILAWSPETAIAVNVWRCLTMTSSLEKVVRIIAIVVLAFELPVPIYWLTLHGPVAFWRRHLRAAFPVAMLAAWGVVDTLLYALRLGLFRRDLALVPALVGMALIAFDVFAFVTSEAVLGGRRLAGQAELAGSRELIVRGLYARVRHPRYLGMMAGVLGACLIGAMPLMWAASILWLLLALLSIGAEERELRARLGPAFAAYAERVPALVPFRPWRRNKEPLSRQEQRP